MGLLAFVAYVGCIVLANVMISMIGLWPVGFGLMAPAGVYMAGFSFSTRDWLQEAGGRRVTVVAIVLGAGISALLSPGLALASGAAFLLSEALDMTVYTKLRSRGLMTALVLSNIVGLAIDSIVFLMLAFGTTDFLPGLLLGKLWTLPPAMLVLWLLRRRTVVAVAA
jgi:queuosine precursor transporter